MAASSSPQITGEDRLAAGPNPFALFAALAVFLLLALWRAAAPTLWNDEVMSVSFARRSWYGLLHGAASDRVHPPLFYSLLKAWIRLGGESPLWLRLLPIATGAAAIPAAAWLCRELRLSRAASAIGLLLVASSGYVVYYGQELRPYALLLLASTLSIAAFTRALSTPADAAGAWLGLALANTLLVYSHYYGWLVVGTQGLWILLRERRRLARFLVSCAAPVLAFAPWALLVAREMRRGRGLAGNLAGLAVPGPGALPRFYAGLVGPYRAAPVAAQYAAAAVVLVVPAVWLAIRSLRRRPAAVRPPGAGILAAFALVPPAAAVLVSVLVRPVFHPRYLVEAAVPSLLLAGAGLADLPSPGARAAFAGAAGACVLWAAADQLARPTRIAWGDLVASRRSSCAGADPAAPVYALGDAAPRPVGYYLEREGPARRVVPIASLDEIAPSTGWLAFHSGEDLEGIAYWSAERPETIRAALEKRGLRVVCEQSSGTERRRGTLFAFAPAAAAP
jgi:hypothetical protein